MTGPLVPRSDMALDRSRQFPCGLVMVAMAVWMSAVHVPAQQQVSPALDFLSVDPDDDYEQADKALCDYLGRGGGIRFERKPQTDYWAGIRAVLDHRGPYVARLTPYALVVAEMLGAKFEILATYLSKATRALTYHSYFVVKGSDGQITFSKDPSLGEVGEFLARGQRRFVFHDRFSTSSYFLPSLYFRRQSVFAFEPGERHGQLTPISLVEAPKGKSSGDLPGIVLEGDADLAAVWDGAKTKFLAGNTEAARALRFIQLPTALPNDLLVYSTAPRPADVDALRKAVKDMKCTEQRPGEYDSSLRLAGDFLCWKEFQEAPSARMALEELKLAAAAPPAPVTIRIGLMPPPSTQPPPPAYEAYLAAARRAIRFAATEFVVFNPDFHQHVDVDWQLEPIHDGALKLTSVVEDVKLEPQEFRISFSDVADDLPKRIDTIIRSRMHRIRYIWPYEPRIPTVIRDVSFSVSEGTELTVQPIRWLDPGRNAFESGMPFHARVAKADSNKFELDASSFSVLPNKELDVKPMSNRAYRVVLVRPSTERPLFRALTVALVGLFAAGGVGGAVDLLRRSKAKSRPNATG